MPAVGLFRSPRHRPLGRSLLYLPSVLLTYHCIRSTAYKRTRTVCLASRVQSPAQSAPAGLPRFLRVAPSKFIESETSRNLTAVAFRDEGYMNCDQQVPDVII